MDAILLGLSAASGQAVYQTSLSTSATMAFMKITKFEHAFVAIEVDDSTIVIDPGKFSHNLPELSNVVGVVLTHEHDDHTFAPHLAAIRSAFPDVPIWGTAGSQAALAQAGIPVTSVTPGDEVTVGPFTLGFYGGAHAIIHSSIPQIANLGVSVNSKFFYSGDSFVVPQHEVDVLAVPSSAPWLKVAEVMDYVAAVKPKVAFPTHDALWAEPGIALTNARISEVVSSLGGTFAPLNPGEQLEV